MKQTREEHQTINDIITNYSVFEHSDRSKVILVINKVPSFIFFRNFLKFLLNVFIFLKFGQTLLFLLKFLIILHSISYLRKRMLFSRIWFSWH